MNKFIPAKDLRAGHSIIFQNQIYLVLEHSFNKTAQRSGIVKCKIKNYLSGVITVQEFTGENLQQANLQKAKANYSYADEHYYVFINQTTFELIEIPKTQLSWEKHFLSDGLGVNITSYQGKILGISLPESVPVIIDQAEQAVRGNTVNLLQKKA